MSETIPKCENIAGEICFRHSPAIMSGLCLRCGHADPCHVEVAAQKTCWWTRYPARDLQEAFDNRSTFPDEPHVPEGWDVVVAYEDLFPLYPPLDKASWKCELIAIPVDAPHELVPSCNRFTFPHWHWPKPDGMNIQRDADGEVRIQVSDAAREMLNRGFSDLPVSMQSVRYRFGEFLAVLFDVSTESMWAIIIKLL